MKIEEQVLSIEQMKHLQELGVDTSDASMCWVAGEDTYTDEGEWNLCIRNHYLLPYNIPTYTTGEILEKLPTKIDNHEFILEKRDTSNMSGVRFVNTGYLYVDVEDNYDWLFRVYENCFVSTKNVLYQLLCWVAKNHKELLNQK